MNRFRRILAFAAIAALFGPVAFAGEKGQKKGEKPKPTIGTKVGHKVPHFKADLWDVSAKKASKSTFDSHKTDKPTAYVFMSRTCPYCVQYQKRLKEMSEAYGKKGLQFVMVYPTRATPQEKKIAYHKSAGFKVGLVNDKDASIAKLLSVKKTPEIVLVSKKGAIVFRGGIDDQPADASKVKKPYLKNACDDLMAGRKVKVTTAPLYG